MRVGGSSAESTKSGHGTKLGRTLCYLYRKGSEQSEMGRWGWVGGSPRVVYLYKKGSEQLGTRRWGWVGVSCRVVYFYTKGSEQLGTRRWVWVGVSCRVVYFYTKGSEQAMGLGLVCRLYPSPMHTPTGQQTRILGSFVCRYAL